MRTVWMAAVLAAFVTATAVAQVPEGAARCEGCHNAKADGMTPRLNGLSADYIVARLRDFHAPASQTAHATYFMWDIATSVGTAQARALAAYFAAQPPTPAKGGGAPVMTGQQLYRSQGCATCHGAEGQGTATGPRLAGQRTQYLRQQLNSFSLSARYHGAMFPRALNMTAEQMTALAAYLGGD